MSSRSWNGWLNSNQICSVRFRKLKQYNKIFVTYPVYRITFLHVHCFSLQYCVVPPLLASSTYSGGTANLLSCGRWSSGCTPGITTVKSLVHALGIVAFVTFLDQNHNLFFYLFLIYVLFSTLPLSHFMADILAGWFLF